MTPAKNVRVGDVFTERYPDGSVCRQFRVIRSEPFGPDSWKIDMSLLPFGRSSVRGFCVSPDMPIEIDPPRQPGLFA